MGKYKAKTIQTGLGIFTHIPAYSDISRHMQPDIVSHIQAYFHPLKSRNPRKNLTQATHGPMQPTHPRNTRYHATQAILQTMQKVLILRTFEKGSGKRLRWCQFFSKLVENCEFWRMNAKMDFVS